MSLESLTPERPPVRHTFQNAGGTGLHLKMQVTPYLSVTDLAYSYSAVDYASIFLNYSLKTTPDNTKEHSPTPNIWCFSPPSLFQLFFLVELFGLLGEFLDINSASVARWEDLVLFCNIYNNRLVTDILSPSDVLTTYMALLYMSVHMNIFIVKKYFLYWKKLNIWWFLDLIGVITLFLKEGCCFIHSVRV